MTAPETAPRPGRLLVAASVLDRVEVRIVGALVIFVAARPFLYSWPVLDEVGYTRSSILMGLLSSPTGLVAVCVSVVVGRRLTNARLRTIPGVRSVRVVAIVGALSLGVPFSIYDYNAWFGHWHAPARLALIALTLLTCRTLAALPPMLVVLVAIVSQFELPIGLYSWTDKRLVVDLLFLAVIGLALGKRFAVPATLGSWVVVAASWYLSAGLGKLELAWIGNNRLDNLFISATTGYGWLDLSESRAFSVAGVVGSLTLLLGVAVVMIECGAVAVVIGRRTAVVTLSVLVALHLGVFLASGICFWKWILVDTALAIALARRWDDGGLDELGNRSTRLVLVILMFGGSHWVETSLAWYDSPATTTFEMTAVGCDGTSRRMGPEALGPYRIVFAQARLEFLTEEPVLINTYGSVYSLSDALDLQDAGSTANVLSIIEARGSNNADERQARRFDQLVREFATAGFERSVPLVGWIAPPHIWGSKGESLSAVESQVDRVDVVMTTNWSDRGRIEQVRNVPVRSVDVLACR